MSKIFGLWEEGFWAKWHLYFRPFVPMAKNLSHLYDETSMSRCDVSKGKQQRLPRNYTKAETKEVCTTKMLKTLPDMKSQRLLTGTILGFLTKQYIFQNYLEQCCFVATYFQFTVGEYKWQIWIFSKNIKSQTILINDRWYHFSQAKISMNFFPSEKKEILP